MVRIYQLKKSDFGDMLELVTDSSVMKNIGNGKIWSKEKLTKFLDQAESDWENPSKYFYWKIKEDKKFIGIISFHVFPSIRTVQKHLKDEYFLTSFIHKRYQGKGIGSAALLKAENKLKEYIDTNKHPFTHSMISDRNIASRKSILKTGYEKYRSIKFHGVNYSIFRKPLE